MSSIAYLSERIRDLERKVERTLAQHHAEAKTLLRQIPGVGPITALSFICVIQQPERFQSSRSVGAFVGLVPRRKQSGSRDPKLGISKTGDPLLRRHLVRAAHYIMTFGRDSDLKRFAQRQLERGRPRQVVATALARKLATVLHVLWRNGAEYEPLRIAEPR